MASRSKSNAFHIQEKRKVLALEGINETLREASQPSQGLCLPRHEDYPPVAAGLYEIATAVMTTETKIADLNRNLQEIYRKLADDVHVTGILTSRGLDGGVLERLTAKLPSQAGIAARIERVQAVHDCLVKFVGTFHPSGVQLTARSR